MPDGARGVIAGFGPGITAETAVGSPGGTITAEQGRRSAFVLRRVTAVLSLLPCKS